MARELIPPWTFVLVVVKREDKFLLVKERDHGGGWYLPGGRAEPGEPLMEAAVREVYEDAALRGYLDGIHQIQYRPLNGSARFRLIFCGAPADDSPAKQHPDEHTLGAGWFNLDEARGLHLRAAEVISILEMASSAGSIYPLSVLGMEDLME